MPSLIPSRRTCILASFLALLTLAIWTTWDGPSSQYILANPLTRLDQNYSSIAFSSNSSYPSHVPSPSLLTQLFVNFTNKSYHAVTRFLNNHSTPFHNVFSKPFTRPFVPPTYYDSDPHGAIELFHKHGVTVCRVYKVCRRQDASLELPLWMANRSILLKSKCGLSNLHFRPTWTLKNRFGLPPYYDWIAPNLPTHALLEFTKVPLSYFFAHRNAKKSLLGDSVSANKVERRCISPFGPDDPLESSRICSSRPEGRIANPAFLVNLESDTARGDAEFRETLTERFFKIHGVEADVFDPSSVLLRNPRACFRSLIITSGFGPETEGSKTSGKSSLQGKHAIDAAKILWHTNKTHGAVDGKSTLSKKLVQKKRDESSIDLKNRTREPQKSTLSKKEVVITASEIIDFSKISGPGNKSVTVTPDRKVETKFIHSREHQEGEIQPSRSANNPVHAKKNWGGKSPTEAVNCSNKTISENKFGRKSNDTELGETQGGNNLQYVKSVKDESKSVTRNRQTGKSNINLIKGHEKVKGISASLANLNVFQSEGGVELFTHRAIRGKSLNDSNPEALEHMYGVCRIHRACRRHDRTIVLPKWMHKYEKDLEAHCGLRDVSYIPDANFNSAYEQIKTQADNKTMYLTGRINKPNHEMELDLMGTRIYRAQEQHFMTDFFHDGIHAFDALFNQNKGRYAIFKRQCLYKSDSRVGKRTVKSRECASIRTSVEKLNPTVIIHERIMRNSPSSRYIHEILRMMPPAGKSGPKALFAPHLSYSGPQASTCFRSIVLTRNSYPPESVMHHKERNVFFLMNNISRVSMRDMKHRISKDGTCRVRVTILKPRKQHMYHERNRKDLRIPCLEILNQHEVVRQVARQLQGVKGNITLDMATFGHDGKGVVQARNVIQESEILLGVNNPTMTSIIFARPHTSVIEVQPFGYSPGPYRSFARSLHLGYHRVMAEPDEETFQRCVLRYYRDDWDTNVELEQIEKARNGLLKMFHDAAQAFSGDISELQLAHRYHHNGTRRAEHIPLERVCARAQRIQVNAARVAEIITTEAETICRLRLAKDTRPLNGTDI